MKKERLMAVLEHGGGCDYTINCGTDVYYQEEIESESDFIMRAKEMEGGDFGVKVTFFKSYEVKPTPTKTTTVEEWTVK